MCFLIPKKVKSVKGKTALMNDESVVKLGNFKVNRGDYLTVYGNMAVELITPNKARNALNFINQVEKNNL